MPEDAPEYDVSISFLARDEAIAKQLADRLEEGLKVFFFPHNQEELAGTNGLESMREPFMEARVVVVLFRNPWGQTPWTRVEQTAIGERSLKHGWSSLMFVQLDKTSALPKWLPETHVRFSFQDYGIDQLIGAIKLRVQEHGGTIATPNALGEARRVQNEAAYLVERKKLFKDPAWIAKTVHKAVTEIVQEIARLAQEVQRTTGMEIASGVNDKHCVLRSGFVSLAVSWRQTVINDVRDGDSGIQVREVSGGILLPGERGVFTFKPRELKLHIFKVELSQTRSLVWTEESGKELLSQEQVADRIVRIFLDLVSRANQGKVAPPSW